MFYFYQRDVNFYTYARRGYTSMQDVNYRCTRITEEDQSSTTCPNRPA